MPCNGDKSSYQMFVETIEQLQEIVFTFQNTHEAIIGGDFNKNAISKSDTKRNICFHRFLDENHLVTKETEHTFIHPDGEDVSTIDFFLYQCKTERKILEIFRNEDYNSNVSDHYPVSLTMSVNPIKLVTNSVKHVNFVPKVKWDKVDNDQYRTYLSENLSKVDLSIHVNLDKAVNTINTVMLDSA